MTSLSSPIVDLNPYTAPYAYWRSAWDEVHGREVPSSGTHLYAFFCEPGRNPAGVRLSGLELFAKPDVPGAEERRPDIVAVEVYRTHEPVGEVIFEGPLEWNSRDVARLEFPEVFALAASVRCHWKSAVAESSYQMHPRPWNVPFGLFDGAKWYGRRLAAVRNPFPEPPVRPKLDVGKLEPGTIGPLRVWQDGLFAHFQSDVLKASFSLVRPRISYLSWDALGTGRLDRNFLVDRHPAFGSGPMLRDFAAFSPPLHWGGHVEVEGNTIRYSNLSCHDDLSIDASWTVEPNSIYLEFHQRNDRSRTCLDAATWRLVWEGRRAHSLVTLAEPRWSDGRNGQVANRGGWHAVSQGTLAFEGDGDLSHHVENLGYFEHKSLSDFQLGTRPHPYGPVILRPGEFQANLHFKVTNLEPELAPNVRSSDVHRGLRRAWGTIFGFRPEHGGMSNNAHSANCHHVQFWPADVLPFTATHGNLPPMAKLIRHTVNLALKGGPGCGSSYKATHDSAPSLVIAAGRCHQVSPDPDWIHDVWPWLREAILHILGNQDTSGMYVSRYRDGKAVPYGQRHPPSSNAWDCVGFGHYDGYAATLAYRALRAADSMARDAGEHELSERCQHAALAQREALVPALFNEKTGWLAGWRSADGQLHDPGCWFVTALAACFDMLDASQAHTMLSRLEAARSARGYTDFRYGLPTQWDPIPLADTRLEPYDRPFCCGGDFVPSRVDGADTYGIFTNGGWALGFVHYYLRALSKYGFHETADQICDDLLESLDNAVFDGPNGDGCEAYTEDGMKSGYEGTLVTLFGVVVPIAQHRGWVQTPEPEWWPA